MACLITRDFSINFQVFYFINLFHQVPPIIPLLFPFQGPLFFLQYHRLSTGILSSVWEYRLAQSSVLHLPQTRKKKIQLKCLLEEWKSVSKTHTKKNMSELKTMKGSPKSEFGEVLYKCQVWKATSNHTWGCKTNSGARPKVIRMGGILPIQIFQVNFCYHL